MRVAILADIHGNREALSAIMADIHREEVSRVIVAGDLVNRGPSNRDVVEMVVEAGWEVLQGNHDQLVADWVHGHVPAEWYEDPLWRPLAWVARQVERWVGYLASLPAHIRLHEPGAQPILIVHGSPRHNREGLHPFLSEQEMCRILEGVEEPVLVCAHTHIPLDRTVNGCRVVNPGAVGVPFNRDPRAQYTLFTLRDDGTWDVEFRRLVYDRRPVCRAFERSGYLASGLMAHIFYGEFIHARSLLYHYERWAREQRVPLEANTWYRFLRGQGLAPAPPMMR
ncbi:MAG: metallophosphoesterase family protein [Ardenticatenia bacterium]|nr:metallophosphoesterase family protein [Ardenticatenia bacterium]